MSQAKSGGGASLGARVRLSTSRAATAGPHSGGAQASCALVSRVLARRACHSIPAIVLGALLASGCSMLTSPAVLDDVLPSCPLGNKLDASRSNAKSLCEFDAHSPSSIAELTFASDCPDGILGQLTQSISFATGKVFGIKSGRMIIPTPEPFWVQARSVPISRCGSSLHGHVAAVVCGRTSQKMRRVAARGVVAGVHRHLWPFPSSDQKRDSMRPVTSCPGNRKFCISKDVGLAPFDPFRFPRPTGIRSTGAVHFRPEQSYLLGGQSGGWSKLPWAANASRCFVSHRYRPPFGALVRGCRTLTRFDGPDNFSIAEVQA
jgi:hypothetical protein